MNTPEKIVCSYFRLNGFFLLPQFTLFTKDFHIHVDLLALRPAGSCEICEGNPLPIDMDLFNCISNLIGNEATKLLIGILVEVKGNDEYERPLQGHYEYARPFFGSDTPIIPISVSTRHRQIDIDDGCLVIPLSHTLRWSLFRFHWMNQNLKHLTKSGSWPWSDEALADLIYFQKIDFGALDTQASRNMAPRS